MPEVIDIKLVLYINYISIMITITISCLFVCVLYTLALYLYDCGYQKGKEKILTENIIRTEKHEADNLKLLMEFRSSLSQ